MEHLAQSVKDSAYEIIKKKKATYYGIAMGVRRICSAIIRDEKSVLPVSVYLDGEFDLSGATLSVPAIVGAKGIEKSGSHFPEQKKKETPLQKVCRDP